MSAKRDKYQPFDVADYRDDSNDVAGNIELHVLPGSVGSHAELL